MVLFSFVLGDFPVAATLVERLVDAWQSAQPGKEHQHSSTRPDNQQELLALQESSEGSSACASKVKGVSQDSGKGSGSTRTPGGKEDFDMPCVPHRGQQLGQAQDHQHQQEGTNSSNSSSRTEGSRQGTWPRLICIADRFPVKERFRVPPQLPRVTVHVQHEEERRTWLQGEGLGAQGGC